MKCLIGLLILAVMGVAGYCWAAPSTSNRGAASGRASQSPAATSNPDIPIACNLNVFSAAERERHLALIWRLSGKVLGRRELADGYAYRFAGEAGIIAELAEWIPLERSCCPFLRFSIELEPGDGPAWLKLTGKPPVKEFIRTEFRKFNH